MGQILDLFLFDKNSPRKLFKERGKRLLDQDLKTRKPSCFYGNEHGSSSVSPSFLFLYFSPSGQISPAYFAVSNDFSTDESLNTELIRPLERM